MSCSETLIKTFIDAAEPKADITAEYSYCEGEKAAGDPGWRRAKNPIVRFTGSTSRSVGVSFGPLDTEVALKPLGVGGSVTLVLGGDVQLSGSFDFLADLATGPSPVNRPKAIVKCTPSIDLTTAFDNSISTGLVGLNFKGADTFNFPFKEIFGDIEIEANISCSD